MLSVEVFNLPRDFSSVSLTVVYIPQQAEKADAMDELYDIINSLEKAQAEAAFIFSGANVKKVLPKYYKHVQAYLPQVNAHRTPAV